ncbi:MAG: hypothetical protein Q7T97_10490 [Burkholderiaceae bacterium]|nr:hypothetical protein [Burkholderiaceae bacterium]
MNDRPTLDNTTSSARTDDRLRSRLRALQPPASAVDALGARVLAQWSERQGGQDGSPQYLGGTAGAVSGLGLGTSHRRLQAGLVTGLVACAVITAVVWVQRPDPSLDELMQADVLSQMAIGEM